MLLMGNKRVSSRVPTRRSFKVLRGDKQDETGIVRTAWRFLCRLGWRWCRTAGNSHGWSIVAWIVLLDQEFAGA